MVTESAYFGIGGVNFCVSSTSWMPMSYVHTGWAPISPCTPVVCGHGLHVAADPD